ncbi:MAG TPA: HNH endonuclease signature motif containing protein [Stenotrophomonas sp.]|nr:HNH endonuclease signature motif containing protein [Stenotrophomonas sp.]
MARLHTVPSRLAQVPSRLATVNSDSWRAGKQGSTARGYGYRWQQYRLRYLVQHPLCVMCEAEGRVEAAVVVDHVVPHGGDQQLFWSASNHQALCKACHDGTKQRQEAAGRSAARAATGRLRASSGTDRTHTGGGSKVRNPPEI